MERIRRSWGRASRGTVLVGVLIALILIMMTVFAVVFTGRQASQSLVKAVQGDRARAAADAAAQAALRESYANADLDGDGTVGSISNDGNTANDPTINNGTRFWAEKSVAGSVVTITARGQNADAARAFQVTLTTGAGAGSNGGGQLFFTRESSAAVRYSAFNTGTQTWGSATTSGTVSNPPIWCAAANSGSSTLVLAADSGKALRYGLANASGVATYSSLASDIGTSNARPFDVGVEPTSGDGLIIYFDKSPTSMRSRTVVSGALSGASSMSLSTADVYWARLVPLSASGNELMALTTDGDSDLKAARWTGSAWTGQTTLQSAMNSIAYEGADGALETTSGRLMVAFSDSSVSRVGYRIYTPGSGWTSTVNITGFASNVNWVRLASKPGSNEIYLAASCSSARLYAARWNGSAWSTLTTLSTSLGGTNERRFDVACSNDGSTAMVMYGQGGSAILYRLWNGSAWSSAATAFTLSSGTNHTVLAQPGPSAAMLVGVVGDSNGGANAWSWNGTSFGAVSRVGTTSTSFKEFEWFAIPPGSSGTGTQTITNWTMIQP